jgi:rRNA maturation endonuclease Nob1
MACEEIITADDIMRRCVECGHLFDDNPGKPICKTCEDWLVTDEADDA